MDSLLTARTRERRCSRVWSSAGPFSGVRWRAAVHPRFLEKGGWKYSLIDAFSMGELQD